MVEVRSSRLSERGAALVAGWGYLAIAGLALFANFFVRTRLTEAGDAAATASNILGSETLFRWGVMSFLVVFVLDVVIAWALYVFFRSVDRDVSLLSAWFRLVYTTILGLALVQLALVLQVLGAGYMSGADAAERGRGVMLLLDAFDYGWLFGLVAFGIHLGLLGYLILSSASMPRLLGILLIVAGGAYVVDTAAHVLMANYLDYEDLFLAIVAIPSLIGELSLALWLLLRGGKSRVGDVQPPVRPRVSAGAAS